MKTPRLSSSIYVMLVVLLIVPSITVKGQGDNCPEALNQKLFNKTLIESNAAAKEAYKNLLCKAEYKTHDEALAAGFSEEVPVFGLLLKRGLTFSKQERDTWKSQNCQNVERNVSYEDSYRTLIETVSPIPFAAFVRCKQLEVNRIGLSCEAETSDPDVAVFRLRWGPTQGDRGGSPVIEGYTLVGGTIEGDNPLEGRNKIIKQGNGTIVTVNRTKDKNVYLSVNTNRGDCPALSLMPSSPIQQPTPPPAPKFAKQWVRVDEAGKRYSQTFTIASGVIDSGATNVRAEAWCRGDMRNVCMSATFSLMPLPAETPYRIYEVQYECKGDTCGWSYNPAGGYTANYKISGDGHSFEWSRLYQNKNPIMETYTAYYEIYKDVCVANCK